MTFVIFYHHPRILFVNILVYICFLGVYADTVLNKNSFILYIAFYNFSLKIVF